MGPQHRLVVLLWLLVLLPAVLVAAQSCEVYEISNNAFCLVRTDYPVFVAAGSSQNDIGSNLLRALNLTENSYGTGASASKIESQLSQLPPDCLASYTALICTMYIPGCNNSKKQAQPIPSPLCLSSCTDVLRDCGPAISNLLQINCSATQPGSDAPLFLNDSETITHVNSNGSWDLQCVRANQYPYCQTSILTNKTALPGFCKVRCQRTFWSHRQAQTVRAIIYFIGWCSMFANLFIVASYLLDPTKRRYPVILALFFSLSYTLNGIMIVIHSIVGSEKVLCKDAATPNTQSSSGLCAFGAIVATFAALSGACWMMMLGINLVYFMNFSKHLPTWSQIPMHIFSWGFPALMVALALGKKKYSGSEPNVAYCGLNDTKFYDYTVIIPFCLLFGISILLALGVVIHVARRTGRKGLFGQSQLLGFLVVLSVMELMAITIRIYSIRYASGKYIPQAISWTACQYAQHLGIAQKACVRPGKNAVVIASFGTVSQIIGQLLVFVFFGLTRQNLHFWRRLLITRSWDTISTEGSLGSQQRTPQSPSSHASTTQSTTATGTDSFY